MHGGHGGVPGRFKIVKNLKKLLWIESYRTDLAACQQRRDRDHDPVNVKQRHYRQTAV
jgi:hypothetical protein